MPISRPRITLPIAVVLAVIGLAASAASLADWLGPAPAFCAESGCATVRASAWSHPLGVPIAGLGLGFYLVALAADLFGSRRVRIAVAAAGGVGALGLVAVQGLAIGAWCKLCLGADGAGVLHAIVVIAIGRGDWPRVRARAGSFVALAGAAAIALPLVFMRTTPDAPPVADGTPDVVARAQTPGVVTIVDFVDFQCPFCRMLATRLDQAVSSCGAPVRIIRKMVPLPQHEHALTAAIAWCCADAQGKGDAMASALIAADPDTLSAEGCEHIAASLGLDLDRYRQDAASPEIRARIEADTAEAKAAGVKVLPTVYIGDVPVVGADATVDDLSAALARVTPRG